MVLPEWSETKVDCPVVAREDAARLGTWLAGGHTRPEDGTWAWCCWILTLETCLLSLPQSRGRRKITNEVKWNGSQAGKRRSQGRDNRQKEGHEGQTPDTEDLFHWENEFGLGLSCLCWKTWELSGGLKTSFPSFSRPPLLTMARRAVLKIQVS